MTRKRGTLKGKEGERDKKLPWRGEAGCIYINEHTCIVQQQRQKRGEPVQTSRARHRARREASCELTSGREGNRDGVECLCVFMLVTCVQVREAAGVVRGEAAEAVAVRVAVACMRVSVGGVCCWGVLAGGSACIHVAKGFCTRHEGTDCVRGGDAACQERRRVSRTCKEEERERNAPEKSEGGERGVRGRRV